MDSKGLEVGKGESAAVSTGGVLLLIFGIFTIVIVTIEVGSFKVRKFLGSLPDEVWEGVAEETRKERNE